MTLRIKEFVAAVTSEIKRLEADAGKNAYKRYYELGDWHHDRSDGWVFVPSPSGPRTDKDSIALLGDDYAACLAVLWSIARWLDREAKQNKFQLFTPTDLLDELIQSDPYKGTYSVPSRERAEHFAKRHPELLPDIERLVLAGDEPLPKPTLFAMLVGPSGDSYHQYNSGKSRAAQGPDSHA
jgi:hypothetical protein